MTCNTCNECNPCEKEKKSCCELKVLAGDCVDVEEVDWQYVVSATCPPRVVAWDGVEVDKYPSPEEGYSVDYEVSAIDNKVGVCEDDDYPGTLDVKLRVESPITREVHWCGTSDGYMVIGLDTDKIKTPDEKVAVSNWCQPGFLWDVLTVDSELIEWHVESDCKYHIKDRAKTFYYNNVCLWFGWSREVMIAVNDDWNAVDATWINFWDRYTWNKDLATRNWILIKESWYYRIFWQVTVENNTWPMWDDSSATSRNRYINLWRWLLKVTNERTWKKRILSTAKHWEYCLQTILRWWKGINVDNNWEISLHLDEKGEIDITPGQSQDGNYNEGPWMTFNMDAYLDLEAWDVITVWYRPQSDMPEANNKYFYFMFSWEDDPSTEFQAVFGWSVIWVQMITPKLFMDWDAYREF